jgi:hypothetical protein
MPTIDRDDLHLAVEHVTGGGSYGAAAYVDRHTGAILWAGDGMEEPLPDDVDDEERYLPVPTKKQLGLGRNDALAFTEQHAPQLLERAEYIFSVAGAFDRFKQLMHEHDLLDAWYACQDKRLWEELEAWAELHDLRPAKPKGQ